MHRESSSVQMKICKGSRFSQEGEQRFVKYMVCTSQAPLRREEVSNSPQLAKYIAPPPGHRPGALPALVGNNRVYRGWGMLVGYYLPGNSPAAPPEHRAGGSTAHEEVQQSQFDPFPPGRCSGGAGSIFCQLKAV